MFFSFPLTWKLLTYTSILIKVFHWFVCTAQFLDITFTFCQYLSFSSFYFSVFLPKKSLSFCILHFHFLIVYFLVFSLFASNFHFLFCVFFTSSLFANNLHFLFVFFSVPACGPGGDDSWSALEDFHHKVLIYSIEIYLDDVRLYIIWLYDVR